MQVLPRLEEQGGPEGTPSVPKTRPARFAETEPGPTVWAASHDIHHTWIYGGMSGGMLV